MYIYRSFYYRRRRHRRTRVNRQMDVFVCFASLEQARARARPPYFHDINSSRRFCICSGVIKKKKLPLWRRLYNSGVSVGGNRRDCV